jgi:hypothetical protein
MLARFSNDGGAVPVPDFGFGGCARYAAHSMRATFITTALENAGGGDVRLEFAGAEGVAAGIWAKRTRALFESHPAATASCPYAALRLGRSAAWAER